MYDEAVLISHGSMAKPPNWRPLERFLPLELCARFMWMHALALEDGSKLQAYKHSETRRYLLIDANGDTWEGGS